MSEPTPAQEAYAADMALDAQIDAWYDAHHKPENQSIEDALSIFPFEASEIPPPILEEVEVAIPR